MDEIKKEVNGIIDNNIPFVPPQKKPLLSPLTTPTLSTAYRKELLLWKLVKSLKMLEKVDMNYERDY